MKMKKILALLVSIAFMFGFVFSGISVAKTDVSINVNVRSSINVGEDFVVKITLTNEDNDNLDADANIDINIYIDDVLVHEEKNYNLGFDLTPDNSTTINISSTSFRVDKKDIWSKNLMDYECGEGKEVRVEVSDDVSDESDTDEIDIEPSRSDYELSFTISPEHPTVNDKVKVHVIDEDDSDLEDARVKFTQLGDNDIWDYDDEYREKRTGGDGEVEFEKFSEYYKFKDNPYSKYQVDVYKKDRYCKVTKYFDTRRTLNITEIPSDMFVGKTIKVKIVDDVGDPIQGATVTLSKAGFHKTFKSDADGYATFTLDETGTYSIVASKSGYIESDLTKQIEVKVKGSMGISITPKDALVGQEVKIVVTSSEGTLLEGAKVTITKPDGSKDERTTPSTGQISYTPSASGTYKVKVEESSHTASEDSFSASNEFKIILPDKIELNKDLTIIVKNQNDLLVEGATVTVSGTSIADVTDKDGKFTFKLENPGDFTITVKKSEFRDGSVKISTQGQLHIKVSPKEVEVDENVGFSVLDSLDNKVEGATLEVTRPDGSKETISGYTYTPSLPGSYKVTASKANYKSATSNFTAKKLPLNLEVELKDENKLIVTVTSKGKPLADIPVSVETIFGGEKLSTDELGIVEVKLVNITETLNVTVTVDQVKYEKKSVVKEVSPKRKIPWASLLLIILILLLIIAIYARMKKGEEGGKKPGGVSLLGGKEGAGVSLRKV